MRLVHAVLPSFTALVLAAADPAPPAFAAVRLNEFCAGPARDWNADGTVSSRDDEWIEIVNTGDAAVSLDGWLLTDGDRLPRLALGGTLPAGGHRVLFGRDAYLWEQSTGHPAFGFSLANSGDQVMLWQITGADTVLVESYTYRSHEAAADRAVGRTPDGGDAWVLYDALNPYVGTTPPAGNGCEPTPGLPNACGQTPSRSTTWGRLKQTYR